MVDDALLAQWVTRLRAEEADAVVVYLCGSYARGQAGPHSDLDLTVLVRAASAARYRSILVEQEDGRLLHVSVAVKPWDEWLAKRQEPARWSFSLPVRQEVRVLWADDAVRGRLAEPAIVQPAGSIELEDFIEDACKVKNARSAGDELALRLAAQDLARLCPSVLQPLNTPTRVGYRSAALQTALALPVAPPHYRDDMLVCLGLTERGASVEDVYRRALRLATGVVDLLRAHIATVADEIEPNLPAYLADGRLHRYVAQGDV